MIKSDDIDIYTLQRIQQHTREHVLLDSLGGRLQITGLIDIETNSTFGQTIDAALERFVRPIRILLNTVSGSGKEPSRLRNVEGADGKFYNLLPNAEPELAAPNVQFTKSREGTLQISGRARDLNELKRLVRRKIKKEGIKLEDVVAAVRPATEPSPVLRLRQELDTAGLRCIAKMAINLFAKHNYAAFLTKDFDVIRSYVLYDAEGDTELVDLVNPTVPIDWSQAGFSTIDHIIGYDTLSSVVTGVVILFGHYQFLVRIGATNHLLNKNRSTYRVNPFLPFQQLDEDFPVLDRLRQVPGVGFRESCRECISNATNAILKFAGGDTQKEFVESVVRAAIADTLHKGRLGPDTTNQLAEKLMLYSYVHGLQRH